MTRPGAAARARAAWSPLALVLSVGLACTQAPPADPLDPEEEPEEETEAGA